MPRVQGDATRVGRRTRTRRRERLRGLGVSRGVVRGQGGRGHGAGVPPDGQRLAEGRQLGRDPRLRRRARLVPEGARGHGPRAPRLRGRARPHPTGPAHVPARRGRRRRSRPWARVAHVELQAGQRQADRPDRPRQGRPAGRARRAGQRARQGDVQVVVRPDRPVLGGLPGPGGAHPGRCLVGARRHAGDRAGRVPDAVPPAHRRRDPLRQARDLRGHGRQADPGRWASVAGHPAVRQGRSGGVGALPPRARARHLRRLRRHRQVEGVRDLPEEEAVPALPGSPDAVVRREPPDRRHAQARLHRRG